MDLNLNLPPSVPKRPTTEIRAEAPPSTRRENVQKIFEDGFDVKDNSGKHFRLRLSNDNWIPDGAIPKKQQIHYLRDSKPFMESNDDGRTYGMNLDVTTTRGNKQTSYYIGAEAFTDPHVRSKAFHLRQSAPRNDLFTVGLQKSTTQLIGNGNSFTLSGGPEFSIDGELGLMNLQNFIHKDVTGGRLVGNGYLPEGYAGGHKVSVGANYGARVQKDIGRLSLGGEISGSVHDKAGVSHAYAGLDLSLTTETGRLYASTGRTYVNAGDRFDFAELDRSVATRKIGFEQRLSKSISIDYSITDGGVGGNVRGAVQFNWNFGGSPAKIDPQMR